MLVPIQITEKAQSEIKDIIAHKNIPPDYSLRVGAGAYTHTSIAIADAIKAITSPVIEVHISNIYMRESYRHHSYLSAVCKGSIVGFGLMSYELAIQSFHF